MPLADYGTTNSRELAKALFGMAGIKPQDVDVAQFYDAFSGLLLLPYQGAKQEGAKGFGKGSFRAWRGLIMNIGAAVFGLSGYSLKGLEKELQKRQLTKLKAELLLIRLRQSIEDYKEAPEPERDLAVERWKTLHP
jgi:hypothetical protein